MSVEILSILLLAIPIYMIYRGIFNKIDEDSRKMYKNPRLWNIVVGILLIIFLLILLFLRII